MEVWQLPRFERLDGDGAIARVDLGDAPGQVRVALGEELGVIAQAAANLEHALAALEQRLELLGDGLVVIEKGW